MRAGWRAICLAAAVWAQPAHALAPVDGPGCVGVTLEECVAWLRATMRVDDSSLARTMADRNMVDVNGRRIAGMVTIYAHLPERTDTFVILLHVRPDGRIERVESNLLHNIIEARTEAVYDASAFYDIAWRLLGRRCGSTSKIELYRFFENVVKPRIHQERQDLAKGLFGLHRVTSHAAGVPICGTSFGYTNLAEWRGSSDREAGRSLTNFSSIEFR